MLTQSGTVVLAKFIGSCLGIYLATLVNHDSQRLV